MSLPATYSPCCLPTPTSLPLADHAPGIPPRPDHAPRDAATPWPRPSASRALGEFPRLRSRHVSRLRCALAAQHPQQGRPLRPGTPPVVPARSIRAHDEACARDLSLSRTGPGLAVRASPPGPQGLGFLPREGPPARRAQSSGPPRTRPSRVAAWRPASCSCGPEDAARSPHILPGLHVALWNKAG